MAFIIFLFNVLRYVLFNDPVYSYAACVNISYFLNSLSPNISYFLNSLSPVSDQNALDRSYRDLHLSLQTSGLLAPLFRIRTSILAMKIFAKATAVSVPIGFPCVCK